MRARLRASIATYVLGANGSIDMTVERNHGHTDAAFLDEFLGPGDGWSSVALYSGDKIVVGHLEASVYPRGGSRLPFATYANPVNDPNSVYALLASFFNGCGGVGEATFNITDGMAWVEVHPPRPRVREDEYTVNWRWTVTGGRTIVDQRANVYIASAGEERMREALHAAAHKKAKDNEPPHNKDWEWENQP